ncbi:MAG: TGS domain-containing protein [Ktedonobacteraceae bacterium]|nr:TGS domain-containing protein [Ktedonobacteraceae bacterium]
MAGRLPFLHTDHLVWKPTPTSLPREWQELYKTLRQQNAPSSYIHILDVRYNPRRTGDLLRDWGLPWQVVMAGYLWDCDKDQIRAAQLKDTEQVLEHITHAESYAHDIEDENLVSLLSPPYRDIGGLLIAVAAYYGVLQEIQQNQENRQKNNIQVYIDEKISHIKIIGETLIHIATRLAMWHFKRNIEDIIEKITNTKKFAEYEQEYEQILRQDAYKLEATRQLFMASYQETTQRHITVLQIPCAVTGMSRRLQDAHTTATSQKARLSGFDLVTFEILVSTVGECYEAFGILSQLGHIQDRVTDLIANPKPNGCSHLAFGLILKATGPRTQHLAWLQEQKCICQIQITTHAMHALAWYGCLQPDYYQLCMGRSFSEPQDSGSWEQLWHSATGKVFSTLREKLLNSYLQCNAETPIVVYDRDRTEFYLPKGGATALDFAFAVSVETGEHAVEAFVNNRKSPLSRVLESGDIVEIRTSREIQVQDYWLDEHYAITSRAREYINASLERRSRDRRGYYLLLQELDNCRFRLTPKTLDEELSRLINRHNLGTQQEYLARLDAQSVPPYTPAWAVQQIMQQMAQNNKLLPRESSRLSWIAVPDLPLKTTKRIFNKQRFCDFCRPVYPHDPKIIGLYRGRRNELVVHKENCPHLNEFSPRASLLPMSWQLQNLSCRATFFLKARDRKGLVHEITERLFGLAGNLVSLQADAFQEEAWVRLTIDANTDADLLDIWQELAQITGVVSVDIDASTPADVRVRLQELYKVRDPAPAGEFSAQLFWDEQISVLPPRNTVLRNPFDISRPATARMFFGRAQETKIMQRELCEGEHGKALLLYGPFRSGKTSLCKNFLERQVDLPSWKVYFSLQNSTGQNEEALFAILAAEICNRFSEQLRMGCQPWSAYDDSDPQIRFRRVVMGCLAQAPHSRLILVLDEFGGALEAYQQGILNHRFFTFWKEFMSEVPQFSLVLTMPTRSHNSLREISHAFSFAETLPMSFLDRESAKHLLVDPLQDQHIAIHPSAVTLASRITGGNPYYMTLIGQQLVHYLNQNREKQKVTDNDLLLIIDSLLGGELRQNFDFLRKELQCPEELRILQAIVELSNNRVPKVHLKRIARYLSLPVARTRQHLERLCTGLILEENEPPADGPLPNPYYWFSIELVR